MEYEPFHGDSDVGFLESVIGLEGQAFHGPVDFQPW
jgi:hypothetical protein